MARTLKPSSPDSPSVDLDRVRTVHLMAIAGTGMGSFAQLLKQAGYDVRGSDQKVWPPMSDLLCDAKIPFSEGFRAENLEPRPDLVIIGNVVRRANPEAAAVRALGLPHLSFPEALGSLFLADRHPIVVAGTHGKTTTTAMLSWLLHEAGRCPSFLVGGMVEGLRSSDPKTVRPPDIEEGSIAAGNEEQRIEERGRTGVSAVLGTGPHFVVEGDEYDTAYFDKGPKLLHYRPQTAILTSVEFDHADIFADEEHYESAFTRFLPLLPHDGYMAVCAGDARAVDLARSFAGCAIETYSAREDSPADWMAADMVFENGMTRFTIEHAGTVFVRASMSISGRHNVENALAATAVAARLGLSPNEIAKGLVTFKGVARRQQVVGEPDGITVIDDFAHHPTAVMETVRAVSEKYPGRRLWAVFEPRSNTARRNLHQSRYACSFDGANHVVVAAPPPHPDAIPDKERLDPSRLVREIAARGPVALHLPNPDEILGHLVGAVQSKDVVLLMSNGSFGGLSKRLVDALERR